MLRAASSVACALGIRGAASAAVLRLAPGLLDVSAHLSPAAPPGRHPRQLESPGPSQRPQPFTSGGVWEPSRGSPHPHNDDLGSWYRIRLDEQVDTPASRHDEGGVFESQHPSQRFAETLSTYRGTYPDDVWQKLCAMYPRRRAPGAERPVAIDIAVGAEGRAGVELSRRGFHIIGVEADATLLARTWRLAQSRHAADMELITAKVEKSMLADGTADLVTFFHGLHLVNTKAALREAHRLLKPGGRLVAAWNDRDLSSPFVSELEDLFEEHVPSYSRHDKQRCIEQWGGRLEDGGLFKLLEYSVHPNPVRLANAHSLLDIVDCFSFVRSTLRGAQRKDFNGAVRRLVERWYGREPFDLPLETKLFVLTSLKEDSLRDPPFRPVHGTLFQA